MLRLLTNLQREQEQKCLNAEVSSIHKIPQKQIVCLGTVAAHLPGNIRFIDVKEYLTSMP